MSKLSNLRRGLKARGLQVPRSVAISLLARAAGTGPAASENSGDPGAKGLRERRKEKRKAVKIARRRNRQ